MKKLILLIAVLMVSLNAQEKPAPKISAFMFGDYFYNVARDTSIASLSNTATNGARDFNGFQFRRIYLTFDGDISPVFTSRFRIEGTTGAPFIKDASIKWKNIFDGSDMIFGLQPTPAFEHSEAVWGYRSLEKTILDLRGIVSARDLAVSLRGKIDGAGTIGYWIMVGNNSGTGAETDKYKRLYAHIDVQPTKKLNISVYGDYKMKSNINDPASTSTPRATLGNNTLTGALFVGYTEKSLFNIGVETFIQSFANGVVAAGPPASVSDKTALGLSLFGSYSISEAMALVGRFDYFDPNDDANGDVRNYIVAGLDYKADKKFSIIPNIQLETYENVPTATGSRAVDPSVTGRITFFYTFL